jgi:hypothetical protein
MEAHKLLLDQVVGGILGNGANPGNDKQLAKALQRPNMWNSPHLRGTPSASSCTPMNWRVLVAAGSILVWFKTAGGESTWVFAVEVSASAQLDPPRITLSWPQDTYGANSYTIYRKSVAQTSWGTGVTLPGSATTYTDNAVSAGAAYEYQVHKSAALGYSGYGYIYAGIQAPPTENRGKVVLVVENSAAAALQPELARLEADLVGDGWGVVRHDVDRAQSPESIRALIVADYQADRSVSAVFLFGHVPIFYSGSIDWDTHGARAMPADGYYGDIDGNWSQLPNLFPSTVELMVGRVDLADMPGFGGNNPWPGEIELLRNYLNKNHRWRHGEMTVQRRSLMGNRRGDEETAAPAASGYRIFAPGCGTMDLTPFEWLVALGLWVRRGLGQQP